MKIAPDLNTILLVDDETDIREVMTMSLEDMGFRVLAAENGAQALEYFKRERPPLVITDIKMPVMDGIELLRKIKLENADTEVIMITGHGDMDLAIKSLKYEATEFVTKPVNVDALEIALKRACEKITIRRKLEEYTRSLELLIQEKTELQDHLSSLGLMIGSISHGLKGQITGLDGGIYLVESGLRGKNEALIREGWGMVTMMVERIRKMVMDILYYAKKRDLHREVIDVRPFVDEIAMLVESRISNHPIRLVKDFISSPVTFEVDADDIHSALVNILENAIDACIRDKKPGERTIDFSVTCERGRIIFTIQDDGIGMTPETVEKIFTLFYSSKGSEGTGFGLFIAEKIIRQHDGEIKVNSQLGKGSRFVVCIPQTPIQNIS